MAMRIASLVDPRIGNGCDLLSKAAAIATVKSEIKTPRSTCILDMKRISFISISAGFSFECGGALSDVGVLGMIAVRRSGTRLEWDNAAMKFTNDGETNALLMPEYRAGWSL